MGDFLGPVNNSVVTNIQVTPTRTVMDITAGPVDITVTWLSPIEVRFRFVSSSSPELSENSSP